MASIKQRVLMVNVDSPEFKWDDEIKEMMKNDEDLGVSIDYVCPPLSSGGGRRGT